MEKFDIYGRYATGGIPVDFTPEVLQNRLNDIQKWRRTQLQEIAKTMSVLRKAEQSRDDDRSAPSCGAVKKAHKWETAGGVTVEEHSASDKLNISNISFKSDTSDISSINSVTPSQVGSPDDSMEIKERVHSLSLFFKEYSVSLPPGSQIKLRMFASTA